MTSDRFENTMHEWLADRAAGRAPDRLHADAMTVIGARRQRVGWWASLHAGITDAPTIGGIRAGTLLRPVAVLVLTLLLGVAIGFGVANRPAILPTSTQSPEPAPTISTEQTPQLPTSAPLTLSVPVLTAKFVRPFTYQLPIDPPSAFHLATEESDIAGFGYGTMPLAGGEYGEFQAESPRGVAVFALGKPWTHQCAYVPGPVDTPSEFLELLGTVVEHEPATSTTFDGRPALTTSFRAGRDTCGGDIHYDEGPTRASKYVRATIASQMIAFEVAGQTIVVDIWARDDAEFDSWLPMAKQFAASIHFVEVASEFIAPFHYSIPSADPQWITGGPELYAFVESREGLAVGGYGAMQASAPRGIAVLPAYGIELHPCSGRSGTAVFEAGTTAEALLEDLVTLGLAFGSITPYQIDDRPGLSTRVLPEQSTCTPELFPNKDTSDEAGSFGQDYVATSVPSQFFAVDLADRTILIDVWAQTDAELDAWLPIAQEFVDSIHFIEQ